jgi:hypothetical protein
MTTRVNDELLDQAVYRLRLGQSADDILKAYPTLEDTLSPLLQAADRLRAVGTVEKPDAEFLLTDRNDFLAEATRLQLQTVSPNPLRRLKGWIYQKTAWSQLTLSGQQKGNRKMSTLAIQAAIILVVAFGSLAGSVAVAADSLPGTVLYPVKLVVEEARLALDQDPADKATMHVEYVQERIREMVQLALKGEVPEEQLFVRTRTHMRIANQLTSQLGDQEMRELLTLTQIVAESSRSDLENAQERAQVQLQEHLQQASSMMAQWRHEAEYGLQDPDYFRWRYGPGGPPCEADDCPPLYGDGHQEQYQRGPGEPPCDGDDCQPPYGDGDQEQNQNQYGPGGPPCDGDDCQPPYGDGDQEQYQHQYGPGEPPCDGDDCQPTYGDGDQEQNQHHYGPGETPCDGDDCQPPYGDGDQGQSQHQYGPGEPPCDGDDCQPPYGDGDQDQSQHQYGPGEPPCDGDDCQPPNGDGDQGQSQHQNSEQNQTPEDTQNQNQEQNGGGSDRPQSGSLGIPGDTGSSGDSNGSSATNNGGGSGSGG